MAGDVGIQAIELGGQSETANSPGTITRVRGSNPKRANQPIKPSVAYEENQLYRVRARGCAARPSTADPSIGCAMQTAQTDP